MKEGRKDNLNALLSYCQKGISKQIMTYHMTEVEGGR